MTTAGSADEAEGLAKAAEDSAKAAEDSAKAAEDSAKTPANAAKTAANAAKTPANAAKTAEDSAKGAEDSAKTPANSAKGAEDSAEAPVTAADGPKNPAAGPEIGLRDRLSAAYKAREPGKAAPFSPMKQTYENDFAMFSTVRDFMNLHTAETSGVPAIGTAVAALVALIAQMDAAAGAQAAPLTGIAEDKDVVRTTLEEAVFIVSEPLSALAAVTNNNTLLDEVSITRSGLDRLSAENLDIWAARVAARAATNQTVLTGTYGVTLAQATAITTARTAFAPWINKPREASAERTGVTASIPALDRQGKTILRSQLDPLMNRFRLTNPTLYAGYRAARVIVDRQGAGGTPTPPPPPPGPPGA
jgi:hypothetical protein